MDDALKNWLDVALRLDEALSHFTCSEAEALADLFRANDQAWNADCVIESHAWGDDDEDDEHHERYLALHNKLHARTPSVERDSLARSLAALTCMRRSGESAATLRKRDEEIVRIESRLAELAKEA